MEELRLRLEKESELIQFDKRTGFPVKALIQYVIGKAEADETYHENLKNENFGEILIYVAEYLIKEIVESQECHVPDEVVYAALDRWILDKGNRQALLEVVSNVKHPQSKNRNPFMMSNFLSKENLDKMDQDFKELPGMVMFIKKYYVEPKAKSTSKTTRKQTVPAAKKTKEPTLFDMLDNENEEVKNAEDKNVGQDSGDEGAAELGSTSPASTMTETVPPLEKEELREAEQVLQFTPKPSKGKKQMEGQFDLFSMF